MPVVADATYDDLPPVPLVNADDYSVVATGGPGCELTKALGGPADSIKVRTVCRLCRPKQNFHKNILFRSTRIEHFKAKSNGIKGCPVLQVSSVNRSTCLPPSLASSALWPAWP